MFALVSFQGPLSEGRSKHCDRAPQAVAPGHALDVTSRLTTPTQMASLPLGWDRLVCPLEREKTLFTLFKLHLDWGQGRPTSGFSGPHAKHTRTTADELKPVSAGNACSASRELTGGCRAVSQAVRGRAARVGHACTRHTSRPRTGPGVSEAQSSGGCHSSLFLASLDPSLPVETPPDGCAAPWSPRQKPSYPPPLRVGVFPPRARARPLPAAGSTHPSPSDSCVHRCLLGHRRCLVGGLLAFSKNVVRLARL